MAQATRPRSAPKPVVHELIGEGERSYSFAAGAPLPDELRRVARGRLAHAVEALGETARAGAETSVHETRKDMKKLRSLLRLVRADLGEETYRRENERFAGAARRLSGARDADVMRATLAGLHKRYPEELPTAGARELGKQLTQHRRELARRSGSRAATMREVAKELRLAYAGVVEWPPVRDDWRAVRRGLDRGYRRGRDGLRQVQKDPTGENVHEWRKRVKDLWYHLSLLEELWPAVMKAQSHEAHELSALLGEDHDLVVLGEFAAAHGAARTRGLERFAELVERRRVELLDQALVIGERLYVERPKAFAARHARLWSARCEASERVLA